MTDDSKPLDCEFEIPPGHAEDDLTPEEIARRYRMNEAFFKGDQHVAWSIYPWWKRAWLAVKRWLS